MSWKVFELNVCKNKYLSSYLFTVSNIFWLLDTAAQTKISNPDYDYVGNVHSFLGVESADPGLNLFFDFIFDKFILKSSRMQPIKPSQSYQTYLTSLCSSEVCFIFYCFFFLQ